MLNIEVPDNIEVSDNIEESDNIEALDNIEVINSMDVLTLQEKPLSCPVEKFIAKTGVYAQFIIVNAAHNFVATRGIDTGRFVLATFYYASSSLQSVADFNPTIISWGDDCTPSGLPPLEINLIGYYSDMTTHIIYPFFELTGSHTYITKSSPVPLTFTVNINSTYNLIPQADTSIIFTGTVVVVDAPLTGSNGTVITGIEGIKIESGLIGTFRDGNQFNTCASNYKVKVKWGDNQDNVQGYDITLKKRGSANNIIWEIYGDHRYATRGVYAITITIMVIERKLVPCENAIPGHHDNDKGACIVISSSAVISEARYKQFSLCCRDDKYNKHLGKLY